MEDTHNKQKINIFALYMIAAPQIYICIRTKEK